jgi:hypothetical protein
VVEGITHLTAFRGFAGTSVLIMVGVATDTARRIRAEQAMAKYQVRQSWGVYEGCPGVAGGLMAATQYADGVHGSVHASMRTKKGEGGGGVQLLICGSNTPEDWSISTCCCNLPAELCLPLSAAGC